MRVITLILVCSIAPFATASAEQNRLSPEQIQEGWISLFDGETLFGWKPTSEADWKVEKGAIRVSQGQPGWLMTTGQFSDYVLHLQFQAGETTNSGIFLRTSLDPKDPTRDCYELNIAPPDNPFPTGSLVGRLKFPEDVGEKEIPWTAYPPKDSAYPGIRDNWVTLELEVQEATITMSLFGREFYRYTDPHPIRRGHIGLQFREGPIAFRNVRLKPLSSKPIFNGRDLTGWNTRRAEESRFEVTPKGELRVLDGRGQLETDASYGDFLLQLECFVNGAGLNSGIFYRCIPGDFLMGYECQISNRMKKDDPTQPADCGTGGIFRRQDARRIVSRDHEWFSMTVLADGPHMATWVNGYPVCDWTDRRKPNENPRRGLRLEPGTIAIQGHDPTTDLRFRSVRIAEMAAGE